MNFKITTGEELVQVLLIVVLLLVGIILLFFLVQLNRTTKRLIAERRGLTYEEFDLGKWWKKINSTTIAVEQENAILLDHDYDGIKELDNHLPPWWINMFYLTIVFAVGYILIYHVWNKAPLSAEEYEITMENARKEVEKHQSQMSNSIDEKTVSLLLDDTKAIANGKAIFDANCMACHGAVGEGTVGPNLTDEFWLHGGSIHDVFKTVKYGVPEKGMISWQTVLRPKDMEDVSNYILSLQGTKPANGKAPEGEKYVPEEVVATATDSTKTK